jgi:hypothetical protein
MRTITDRQIFFSLSSSLGFKPSAKTGVLSWKKVILLRIEEGEGGMRGRSERSLILCSPNHEPKDTAYQTILAFSVAHSEKRYHILPFKFRGFSAKHKKKPSKQPFLSPPLNRSHNITS